MVNFGQHHLAEGLQWQLRGNLAPEDRPSDTLLRIHFQQALVRHVLGRYYFATMLCYERKIEAFRKRGREEYDIDLEHSRWITGEGKQLLENYVTKLLFPCLPAIEDHFAASRFPLDRFYEPSEPTSWHADTQWPDSFIEPQSLEGPFSQFPRPYHPPSFEQASMYPLFCIYLPETVE